MPSARYQLVQWQQSWRGKVKNGLAWLGLALLISIALVSLWVLPKPARQAVGEQFSVQRPDGARISYSVSGQNGPYVLLLASLGRSVSDFNELVLALNTAGYRTVAVDFRGVGKSSIGDLSEPFTLFDLADDAKAALGDAGVQPSDPVFVIGHAFGNRVARAYSTRNTSTVRGIVLIAAGGSQQIEPRVAQAMLNGFKWWIAPAHRKSEIRYAFFADGNTLPSYWVNGWYKDAAQLQIRAVQATPVSQWRDGGAKAPILVLQAMQDRIAPIEFTSAPLKEDLGDIVEVKTIENAGHALLPEQPIQIRNEILVFLNNLSKDK
jgi:pimeloyl-ACP methyl ester carboxylesterase